MSRIRWYGPSIVLLLTVLIVMITGPRLVRQIAWAQTDARISLVKNQLAQNEGLAQLSESFRQVSDVVEPSVVSVEVLSRGRERGGPQGDMLRRWFFGPEGQGPQPGPFGPRQMPQPRQDEFEQFNPLQPYGNGSGWVYDDQGHIITNNHVIENADKVRVRFSDGSTYDATVVGTDPNTDVAVLKVDAADLHPASISQEIVEQGDIVFAFGSPFRFDFSMSMGIVSAKGRQLGIIGPGGYENFIQTDAAINPGNSGGPLTNIYGQVVGMNTAIASRTGAYNGLGFAIPAAMVVDVAEQLIGQGRVSRGYLGVYIEDLTPRMAQTFGYEGEGVLVTDPIEGSPADQAGLQAGDIVTAVNGNAVDSADQLRYRIAGFAPGSTVELTVFRNGETLTKEVTLTELPSRGLAQGSNGGDLPTTPDAGSEGVQALRKLGIRNVQTFTEAMAQELGVAYEPGVVVRSVRPNSVAATAGIGQGLTLITHVVGEPVEDAEELIDQIEEHDVSEGVRLRVAHWDPRQETFLHRFVLLELPE